MSELRGGETHTCRQTNIHINTMTRPRLGAGPSEKMLLTYYQETNEIFVTYVLNFLTAFFSTTKNLHQT